MADQTQPETTRNGDRKEQLEMMGKQINTKKLPDSSNGPFSISLTTLTRQDLDTDKLSETDVARSRNRQQFGFDWTGLVLPKPKTG